MNTIYPIEVHDLVFLRAGDTLLQKLSSAQQLKAAELVSVAKLRHAWSQLPGRTAGLVMTVDIGGPCHRLGEVETHQGWLITMTPEQLSVESFGYFRRPSTGGESFLAMQWNATPLAVDFIDYRRHLAIVPGLKTFPKAVQAMEFDTGTYTVSIEEDQASLSDEEERIEDPTGTPEKEFASEAKGLDEDRSEQHRNATFDCFEKHLAQVIDWGLVKHHESIYFEAAIRNCARCRQALANKALFVHGQQVDRNQGKPANVCASCFYHYGRGIGAELGQLYARQANGSWRLVSGF